VHGQGVFDTVLKVTRGRAVGLEGVRVPPQCEWALDLGITEHVPFVAGGVFADPRVPEYTDPNANLDARSYVANGAGAANHANVFPRWSQPFKDIRLSVPNEEVLGGNSKTGPFDK